MRIITTILFATLALAGPAFAADTYFVDGTGHKVEYGLNAKRIVSLAPSVTEMLFFLGLGDRVVGRSNYCNYPPEATKLPSVGGFVDTSIEKIVSLQPDLVVAYQGNSLEVVGQLRQLKINVIAMPEAGSVSEVSDQMDVLRAVTYRNKPLGGGPPYPNNQQLLWARQLDELKATDKDQGPNVFYGMPGEVTYSAAPGSFIDDLITLAGGRNVIPSGKQRWPQVNAEFILAAQPEWLLISTPCAGHTELKKASDDILASLAKDPVWSKLPAVKKGQIVVIDADVLLRPGPRILDALEQLTNALSSGNQ
ncbi:MAG: helical backbone metal receptor [bacterium]|nr:helical backbone metal receptor [bacterium]